MCELQSFPPDARNCARKETTEKRSDAGAITMKENLSYSVVGVHQQSNKGNVVYEEVNI